MRCATNPSAGREGFFDFEPADVPKKVIVVGGGPAGMETAMRAKQRGHLVSIIEKENRLGGTVNVATVPAGKTDLADLVKWYKRQLVKLDVDIRLGTEVTNDLLKQEDPDSVIFAMGATQSVPLIQGINTARVVKANDVILGRESTENIVAIIGAGLVGVETALYLSNFPEKDITLIEAKEAILGDVVSVNALAIKDKLEKTNIKIKTSTSVVQITDDELMYVDRSAHYFNIPAETVVLAAGSAPVGGIEELTKGLSSEILIIGVDRPDKIIDAVESAAVVASRL
jgi:2-enoate reductase